MLDRGETHRAGFDVEARAWLADAPLNPMTREGDLFFYRGDAARRATPFEKGALLGGVALPLADRRYVLVVIGTT